jgi:deaminated glutathione amidase
MTTVAAVQMQVGTNVAANLEAARELVTRAAEAGATYVQLPEYCTFLGPASQNAEVAEKIPGRSTEYFAALARQLQIYLHAGSMLEHSDEPGKSYNTSLLFDPRGGCVASYRKVHLFDIDVPGEVAEKESDAISPGLQLTVVTLPDMTLGMSICFDLRFPEMYGAMARAGANVFAIPAAFASATGRAHWETLLRARAIEEHAYVIAAGQCGPGYDGWVSHGHSMIVSPWGEVLAAADGEHEAVILADIDAEESARRRNQVPVLTARRPAAYEAVVRVADREEALR